MSDPHPLDNVVWSALTTAHRTMAFGVGLARHYPRDMVPFSAIAEPSVAAYADLAAGLAPDIEARLFRPREEAAPPGWETLSVRPIVQMVMDQPNDATPQYDEATCIKLGQGDAAEMVALAEATKPGPVGMSTVNLGRYLGARDPKSRALIAMAGERLRLPGYIELSAICVHPAARGRGLGSLLMQMLMREAEQRNEVPCLHVFPDNPAMAIYERLGFRERTRLWVIWRRPIKSSTSDSPTGTPSGRTR
jgi:ribosomal protein S18 acetylase RimI-like enzyme